MPFALAHPTQLSKKIISFFFFFFTVWHPLSTDLPNILTYLLTDLVTYLLTCLVPRKQLHLVQKIYFGRKIVTSPHFTQPNVQKTKLNNQPSLSLYFHLMTLSHPTWPNCKRPVHFFPLYFGDASQPQFSWEQDLFLFFWKDLPVWWGPSGFWKLLSSLENNFQRPKVLIISLFFSVFNSVSAKYGPVL